MGYREESDTMGTVRIPEAAYYGAQTLRAAENFPISDLRFNHDFISQLARIKKCAATANCELGILDKKLADVIVRVAEEVLEGELRENFIVDLFQTGSGTSTNMNMNEVIATRANEILNGSKNSKSPVHPNDHVNKGQSSNDVIPSTIHITAAVRIRSQLLPALDALKGILLKKVDEFAPFKKIGRTHLQDAVTMTLGQEFSGYREQIATGMERLESAVGLLYPLALGGTAVGTGLNTHPEFARRTISLIATETGVPFYETENHFAAQGSMDRVVEVSGVLKVLAVSLTKIANDIRWLSSGPRCGLEEIRIPSLQPGSSIMPGKVNPVIPEMVLQVAAQVIGNDATITIAGQSGNLELNVMLPVMAHNILQAIDLLGNATRVFAEKCIAGVEVNRDKLETNLKMSLGLATNLIPLIGYDKAAAIAKKSLESGKTVPDVAEAEGVITLGQRRELFD